MSGKLGDSPEQYSEELHSVVSWSERLSNKRKYANNKAWFKRRIDAIDSQYSDTFDADYIKDAEDCYRLMNGMSMTNYTHKAYKTAMPDMAKLKEAGISLPNFEIEHFDWVRPFIDNLWGDQKRRKLRFTITDSSRYTQNYIKDQRAENLKIHFETKLLAPTRQLALLQWQADNGVTDLFSLNDEQRAQLQAEVNASVESMIPKDIRNFLKFGPQGSLEKQGQALADALANHKEISLKYKLDEAYRHSFATDGIVFYTGIRRSKPFLEWVDLTEFNTGGSKDTFIDNNTWFKRVQNLSPDRIVTDFSHKWTREDWKRFDAMVRGGTGGEGDDIYKDEKFVAAIDFAGKELMSKTDLRTTDGQQKWSAIEQVYTGSDIKDFDNIRVVHVVWASLAKMKEITRGYEDRTIRNEYFTEDYVFNPLNGDLKEKTIWVKQYCQGWKIGQGQDPIYVDCGPVPYQYRDITDPYECRSPFTGGFLHDMNGRGFRRSPLHSVKPFIHAANFQMKTIRDREATDIGKVVLMTVAAKPKGWDWGTLIEVVRATKMLPINTQTSGLTAADVQFFREIDLSNLYDILPRINYLQFLISRIGEGLSNNAARQGNPAASTSVGNNMQNLSRSFSQTHGRASWIDKIAEHTLENLVYYGKQAAKDGNIFMRYVLDDLSIASIDIDISELDDAYFGVHVTTDEGELEKLDIGKNLLLPFIQNNNLSFKLAIDTIYAASRGEFLNIATEAEMEQQIKSAQSMDFQKMTAQQIEETKLKTQQMLLELKNNLEMIKDAQNNEAKKDMAALQSMTLANANDINQNNENDYLESANRKLEFEREKTLIQDNLERDKLALEDAWTTKELEIQKEKVRKMSPPTKKTTAKKK